MPNLDSRSSSTFAGAISPLVSHNFAIAKVLAILLVASRHFFAAPLLWIPAAVALFVFAWSSALFTTIKHSRDISVATFWLNKLRRLGLHFLLIQFFLLALAAIRGKSGIFTWQTLVHLTGQTGWLNWFEVQDSSPLGGGLWFFTLLLIFYATFPFLVHWQRQARISAIIVFATLIVSLLLSAKIDVGHTLWITAAAFVVGIHCALHSIPGNAKFWATLAVAGTCCMGLLNVILKISAANVGLIVLISIATVLWLLKTEFKLPAGPLSLLTPCILEIYLIHGYLFVRAGWPSPIEYLVSMAIIVICSFALHSAITYIESLIFSQR